MNPDTARQLTPCETCGSLPTTAMDIALRDAELTDLRSRLKMLTVEVDNLRILAREIEQWRMNVRLALKRAQEIVEGR